MKDSDIASREATWAILAECRTKARAIAYQLRQLEPGQVNEEEGTTLEDVVSMANTLVDSLGPCGIGRPTASDEWKAENRVGGSRVLEAQRRFWRNSHGSE